MKQLWVVTCALVVFLWLPCKAGDWPQWRGPARDGHVVAGQPVPESLPATPEVLWHIPLGEGVSSPIVTGNVVLYEDAAEGSEMLHAAEALTGKELWHAKVDDLHKDSQTKPGPRCTPLSDGTLV